VKRINQIATCFFGYFFSLILAAFLSFPIYQTASCQENSTNSEICQVKVCQTTLKGIELLYNLEFDVAEGLFQEVVAESPDRPAGYFYLAMVTWSRMVAGFWAPETVNEYKKRIDRTVQVAKARINNKAADISDYFYLGGALGFMGRYEMMQGKWFSSFLVSKKAIKAMKTCLKIDPDNRDILLGIGTFDYYTARLSGVLKFLSYFLLHKGDKDEGLRKLYIAAREGTYSATEAKSVLLHIYLFFEEDCSEALPLARELGESYDQDPRYPLFQGVACIRLGLDKEYIETVSYMRERSRKAPSAKKALLWKRRSLYLESIHDLFHFRYPEARSKLQLILMQTDKENDPAMIAWPIVKIGLTYDFEGDRKTAKTYYRKVMNMENASGAQFMAEEYMDKCPWEKDPALGY
jgi:tetratricopeptide (TPR) repeat protein